MKTAQEILLEEKTTRMQRETSDQNWTQLVNQCRVPSWLFWYQAFMFILIAGAVWRINPHIAYRDLATIAVLFLILCVLPFLLKQQRRVKGLLAIIERESPQLFQKLKHESIA